MIVGNTYLEDGEYDELGIDPDVFIGFYIYEILDRENLQKIHQVKTKVNLAKLHYYFQNNKIIFVASCDHGGLYFVEFDPN